MLADKIEVAPGDIGIFRDNDWLRFSLLRVVKVGAVMWEVEEYWGGWGRPARRKVTNWTPLPNDIDPQEVKRWLSNRADLCAAQRRAVEESYVADVRAYALRVREAGNG